MKVTARLGTLQAAQISLPEAGRQRLHTTTLWVAMKPNHQKGFHGLTKNEADPNLQGWGSRKRRKAAMRISDQHSAMICFCFTVDI